jgi:hypothetical protein
LVVADVRQLKPDEHRLLGSLQGLVNRAQPRIYLIAGVYVEEPNLDERWLTWLRTRGDIDGVRRVSDPMSLLREFRSAYRGVVVTDPNVPATVNVATMIAATEDLLIASPELANRLKLPVRRDLRGRWKTNADALSWAVDKLWPKLNHRLLAFNAPGFPFLTDYLVAQKAFAFWVSGAVDGTPPVGSPLAEQLVMQRLLAKASPNIGCLGAPYYSQGTGMEEGPGVALLSHYGDFLAWSSQNCNLSVHSGTVPRAAFRQKTAPCPPLDRNKVYISLMVSDGDSPTIWYGFFLKRYWDDPAHGAFPLTWSMGPSVYDLMPDIMDYYYTHATDRDCFIAAPSGAGYCYPDFFASQYADPKAVFSRYADLTDEYMRRLDLHGLWSHITTDTRLNAFAENVPSISFLMPDYGRLPGITAENANTVVGRGVPVFHALTSCDMNQSDDSAMRLMLDDIRRFTPAQRPGFMHVFVQCYPWNVTRLQMMLQQLGPQYVVVRGDHLAQLYMQSRKQ